MQLSTFSSSYQSFGPRRKFLKEEIELRDRPESEISPWWKIITVSSYFLVVTGGIITSITVGTLLAAFSNQCLFYARITVKGLDEILSSGSAKVLDDENIVEANYGTLGDCTFSQYWSVASTIFGGAWGVLFLQCGRGGISRRNESVAWIIVPPALLVDIVFFVVSCIIFGSTTGGLSFFCNNLRAENEEGFASPNITTCKQIMEFRFPTDQYDTDLYLNYLLAQIGAFLTFMGWLITLFLVILRCFIPVDFIVYGRKLYEIGSSRGKSKISSRRKRKIFANSRSSALDEELFPSTTTSVEVISDYVPETSAIATTSFSTIPAKKFS